MGWRLKRVNQCKLCPWRVDVDPFDIPDGYDPDKHAALKRTIAEPGSLISNVHVMACHEHTSDEGVYCVGWLMNQLGPGNNLPLRIQMMTCDNIEAVTLHGDQHPTFEDTLP